MISTRRSFLKALFASASALSLRIPAADTGRPPYVEAGDIVDHIGTSGPGSKSFVGGKIVHEILPFDGVAYPCIISYGGTNCCHKETVYDVDISNFRKDVPNKFWHNNINRGLYNNVHEYVRAQRYGESVEVARKTLNFYSSNFKEVVA